MIEIINKPLLLHLVGYLYYWQMGFNSVFKGLNTSCKLNEENAVRFRLGIWILRVLRKRTERGRCPLCGEEENE
jgi:hypothetical protein